MTLLTFLPLVRIEGISSPPRDEEDQGVILIHDVPSSPSWRRSVPSLARQTLISSAKQRKLTSSEIADQMTYPQAGQPLSEVRDVLQHVNRG
jgi:hypothetical protein